MKFTQELMHNGEPNPGRWLNEDRTYSVAMYNHYPNSQGKYVECAPWFAAYQARGGNRITEYHVKLTFEQAVAAAEEHKLREGTS